MSLRILPRAFVQPLRGLATRTTCPRILPEPRTRNVLTRGITTTLVWRDRSFTNLLADEVPPPVQVSSITDEGILLGDGLLLPSSCIFLDGHVFLWDVPQKLWEGWGPERFEFFEATLPRPGACTAYSTLNDAHTNYCRDSGAWNWEDTGAATTLRPVLLHQVGYPA